MKRTLGSKAELCAVGLWVVAFIMDDLGYHHFWKHPHPTFFIRPFFFLGGGVSYENTINALSFQVIGLVGKFHRFSGTPIMGLLYGKFPILFPYL